MNASQEWPNGDLGLLKTDAEQPKLNDLGIRAVMIPVFGLTLPHLVNYFGPYGPGNVQYWIGLGWAVLTSAAIWHGNRYFLLRQREHFDWFQHPVRKLSILVFASVFYTAPCAILMTLAWYWFAGIEPDWEALRNLTLLCIVCVAFITHVYETVYLIQQRENDLVSVERLRRAHTQAELAALKAQVAPHFLFNSLNTLAWLIEHHPTHALEYTQNLADVYRYILLSRQRELVPLQEEWQFVRQYCDLLRLRFEEGIVFDLAEPDDRTDGWYVPPISIQVLIENAVKHNEHSRQRPMRLTIRYEQDSVVVENDRNPRLSAPPSAGEGLRTLRSRCRLLLGRDLEVVETPDAFCVYVPVRQV
jgi:hypothetical protein